MSRRPGRVHRRSAALWHTHAYEDPERPTSYCSVATRPRLCVPCVWASVDENGSRSSLTRYALLSRRLAWSSDLRTTSAALSRTNSAVAGSGEPEVLHELDDPNLGKLMAESRGEFRPSSRCRRRSRCAARSGSEVPEAALGELPVVANRITTSIGLARRDDLPSGHRRTLVTLPAASPVAAQPDQATPLLDVVVCGQLGSVHGSQLTTRLETSGPQPESPRAHRSVDAILELGPGYSPIAPKADGWNTVTIDHGTRDELVAKYTSDPYVDESRVEEVDVVWQSGALQDSFRDEQHGTFDACIASHVLEHIPDPIGLFQSLERLLKPSGLISLVVPDKRFCFDFFKPLSSVGELLDAHRRSATRHSAKTAYDHVAYSIRSEEEHCWSRRPVTRIAFHHDLVAAKSAFDAQAPSGDGPYVDYHAWHFTPSSFSLAMLELQALGETSFRVDALLGPKGCEFYATLRMRPSITASDVDVQRRTPRPHDGNTRGGTRAADLLLGERGGPTRLARRALGGGYRKASGAAKRVLRGGVQA